MWQDSKIEIFRMNLPSVILKKTIWYQNIEQNSFSWYQVKKQAETSNFTARQVIRQLLDPQFQPEQKAQFNFRESILNF